MTLGTFLGLVVSLTMILGIATALLIYILAGLRIFFTFCPGGEIVAIVKGKEPKRFIMAHKGFHLNDPDDKEGNFEQDPKFHRWDVMPNNWREKPAEAKGTWDDGWKDTRNWMEKNLGIYWLGVYPFVQVHRYPFQWSEVQQKAPPEGEEGKPGLTVKVIEETVYSIFAKVFPYLMELGGAQTFDKLPVKVRYVLNIRSVNPLKALFWVDNWLAKTQTAANENARDYIGETTYEYLTSETRAEKERYKKLKDEPAVKGKKVRRSKSFEQIMLGLNGKMGDKKEGLEDLYGIEIVTVEIQSVDLAGDLDKEASRATTALYVAEQEAHAARARAQGKRDALSMEAEIMQKNPFAARLRELQALENAGANVTIVGHDIGVVPMLPVGTGTASSPG